MSTKIDDIKILYEDKDIVAINKPAGLIVHPDGKKKEESVIDWVLAKYPETKDVGEPIEMTSGETIQRPGIVHRIDRDTSGVLLIAKTTEGFDSLKEQFHDRKINKNYLAFVYGNVKQDRGMIDRPIARSSTDFRLWSAQRGSRGEKRDALTYYSVIKRGDGFTYLRVMPKTGRTHQIRVHLKAIHHPIVSDSLYAPNKEKLLGFSRVALHASNIEFVNTTGEKISVEAPLPEDFVRALSVIS